MSREMSIIVLGLWIAVLPYLGFPGGIKTFFFVLSGLALAGIGFFLRGETLSKKMKSTSRHPFVENRAEQKEHTPESNG